MIKIPIPLPLELNKNGFRYSQILRSGEVYIYEQRVTKNTKYYEVFMHRISPEKKIKGKTIPSRVRFPNDEAFGYWAWTFSELSKAIDRFFMLQGIIKEHK